MKVCIAGGTSTLTTFYISLYIVYPLMFGVISIYVGNKREVKWQHLSGIEHKVSGATIMALFKQAAFAFLFIYLKTNKPFLFLFVCLFVCFLFVFQLQQVWVLCSIVVDTQSLNTSVDEICFIFPCV